MRLRSGLRPLAHVHLAPTASFPCQSVAGVLAPTEPGLPRRAVLAIPDIEIWLRDGKDRIWSDGNLDGVRSHIDAGNECMQDGPSV